MKESTIAELEKQAHDLIWVENKFKDAIRLIKNLLKNYRPRYPLYYLLLSDCYMGMALQPHDSKSPADVISAEKSVFYWDKAWDYDIQYVNSEYFESGIDAAARYLLETQDLEKAKSLEEKRLQMLSEKKVSTGEIYQAMIRQLSINEDPEVRLKYFKITLSNSKKGLNRELYTFDANGQLVNPSYTYFFKQKMENPKRQLILHVKDKNPVTGEESIYSFNICKNIQFEMPTESVLKARRRRNKYNDNNKEKINNHQREYDSKNRDRKRVRNKLDYSWRQSGLVKDITPKKKPPIEIKVQGKTYYTIP